MSPDERRLLQLFRGLPEDRRAGLLDYAEYLRSRAGAPQAAAAPAQGPLNLPRPDEEAVVKAIKRLMANYPMLDRGKLLNETSELMTQHVLHRRPAKEVIDELEALFLQHYEAHVEAGKKA